MVLDFWRKKQKKTELKLTSGPGLFWKPLRNEWVSWKNRWVGVEMVLWFNQSIFLKNHGYYSLELVMWSFEELWFMNAKIHYPDNRRGLFMFFNNCPTLGPTDRPKSTFILTQWKLSFIQNTMCRTHQRPTSHQKRFGLGLNQLGSTSWLPNITSILNIHNLPNWMDADHFSSIHKMDWITFHSHTGLRYRLA
jgi:hypothetical protein